MTARLGTVSLYRLVTVTRPLSTIPIILSSKTLQLNGALWFSIDLIGSRCLGTSYTSPKTRIRCSRTSTPLTSSSAAPSSPPSSSTLQTTTQRNATHNGAQIELLVHHGPTTTTTTTKQNHHAPRTLHLPLLNKYLKIITILYTRM